MQFNPGISSALLAAGLFGASTPLAKLLVGEVPPIALAGLLYAGSGIGLLAWLALRRLGGAAGPDREAGLTLRDWPWMAGSILFGGIVAPILLMVGVSLIPAATASLLLNLEGVFTVTLAWFAFREHFDRRIAAGMALIVVGGVLLSWEGQVALTVPWGALAVAGACLGWALDNNLTRKVSASDPVQIAAIKGLVAGIVNLSAAHLAGVPWPGWLYVGGAGLVGLLGYGVSLVLFVLALRHLGVARTAAYFSTAPFIGAILAMGLLRETTEWFFWMAAVLMGGGIWLHLTERHGHLHAHEEMTHAHPHLHDEHHRHEHDFSWNGSDSHTHAHTHGPQIHWHLHYPDLHHRHGH